MEHAGLQLEREQADLMRELSGYYMQSQYPDDISAISASVSKEQAVRILDESEGIVQWLSSMI